MFEGIQEDFVEELEEGEVRSWTSSRELRKRQRKAYEEAERNGGHGFENKD